MVDKMVDMKDILKAVMMVALLVPEMAFLWVKLLVVLKVG
jgi:hypothetical protein